MRIRKHIIGRFQQVSKETKIVSWTKSEANYEIHFDRGYTLVMNEAEFKTIESKLKGLGK